MNRKLTKDYSRTNATVEITGYNYNIWGRNLSDRLYGDVSKIRGDASHIYGDCSGISGDVTGVHGHVSKMVGNLDECQLTQAQRKDGISIEDLVSEWINPIHYYYGK